MRNWARSERLKVTFPASLLTDYGWQECPARGLRMYIMARILLISVKKAHTVSPLCLKGDGGQSLV